MASGTAPNTSMVLTDEELEFINTHFNGSKSAAVHTALEKLMSRHPESAQVFTSREDAQKEVDTMKGWNNIQITKVPREAMTEFDPPELWIIKTEGGTLCEDGYVRTLR